MYLLEIPTSARKARLLLEWNRAMFFPPVLSHFGFRRTRRTPTVIAAVPDKQAANG